MRDVIGAPAAWLARAIRDKKVSSVEVVRAHLEHIHTVNPRLNAVVFATAESAIKEARTADRHNRRKASLGPLHGVPFTAKDIFNTAGLPTTAGLRMLRTHVPDHDATAIARMRRAGAGPAGPDRPGRLRLWRRAGPAAQADAPAARPEGGLVHRRRHHEAHRRHRKHRSRGGKGTGGGGLRRERGAPPRP